MARVKPTLQQIVDSKKYEDHYPYPGGLKGKHRYRETGLIYFVEAIGLDRLKIGYTTAAFKARLAVIQTGSPVEVRPLLVLEGKTLREEGEIHRMFKRYRTHGEWYVADREIVAYIGGLCKTKSDQQVRWDDNLAWLFQRKLTGPGGETQFDSSEVDARIGYHPDGN